ncbi:12363_t:CDS:2 [Cetraspora pellucida]|uniref:12363_t:CDS:1 n=1 Tax=Cetraspora pellucida TaxID=1433469 RepID=A0A9N9BQZ1_9GLOM|nr:12363_t:CDS:2 [Cetraspora pellucida]
MRLLLIGGIAEIDVNDLKEHTNYQGYTESDEIIQFKDLQGSDGPRRFTIEKVIDITQLLKSHTCVSNNDSNSTDSILSEKDITKFKAKVIIELDKSDSIPAKWFTFELDNFGIFQDSLVKHIQICINNDNFNKNDI